MALTPGFKKLMVVAGIATVAISGYQVGTSRGWIPGKSIVQLVAPKKVELSNAAPLPNVSGVPMLPLPSTSVLGKGEEYRSDEMGWQSQNGVHLANGGPTTTKGSIMESEGITNFKIIRQDNCDTQVNDLIAFGAEFKAHGGNPKKGVQFINLMLDGSPSYMKGLKEGLAAYGLHPKIIATFGKSDGEDTFDGPEAWKKDPKNMKGGIVIGVLYDGDMNIAIKFAHDNDVRINPDPKTYDPDALNIYPAEDYLKAPVLYNNGIKEERTIVRNGVPGDKITISTKPEDKKAISIGKAKYIESGVVTWFPGDDMAAKGRGGVTLANTHDYYWQMPHALITIQEWADANRPAVKKILKAAFKGGEQVKVHEKALYRACEITAKIYGPSGTPDEKKPEYWYKGFKRTEVKPGLNVGGSMNFCLADNIKVFGIDKGDGGPAASSYTVFGNKMVELWPKKMDGFPAWDEAFDPSFIKELVNEGGVNNDLIQEPVYKNGVAGETFSSTTQPISFASGSAALTASGRAQLNKLYNEINITGMYITIIGHADNVGNHTSNQKLSEARAMAARDYLMAKGLKEERFRTVEGWGDKENKRAVVFEMSK